MKNFPALVLVALISAYCTDVYEQKDVKIAQIENTNCDSAICTYDYRTVNIHLYDKNGRSIDIKEFKVYYSETGMAPELTNPMLFSDASRYEIANDGMLNDISFNGTKLTFEAKLNNLKTFKTEITVYRDCCHIYAADNQKLEFKL